MILWFFANGFYNLGLLKTSITSSNTLSCCNIIFIFGIKMIFFGSKCTPLKMISSLIAAIGIYFIGHFEATVQIVPINNKEDSKVNNHNELPLLHSSNSTLIGDIYILLGALFYSIYSIYLKKISKQYSKDFDMMEMFGYMGLYNFLLIPFTLVFFQMTLIEVFVIPSLNEFIKIFFNALISGIISDLLQNYSITLLSPIMVSFGLTLVSPISFTYDIIYGKISFNFEYLIGSIMIILSFILMVVDKYYKKSK